MADSCSSAKASPDNTSPEVGFSVPGLSRSRLICPLLRETAAPRIAADGSSRVPAVESRTTVLPLSFTPPPTTRLGIADELTPLRTTGEMPPPLTRTKAPSPLPRLSASPRRSASRLPSTPVARMREFFSSLSSSSATRMMSEPVSAAPELSRVTLPELTVSVLPSGPKLRSPPMSRLSAPKLFSSFELSTSCPLVPPPPDSLIRMSAALLISITLPRPVPEVVEITPPCNFMTEVEENESLPASTGNRGIASSRARAALRITLFARRSWYSDRARTTSPEAISKRVMLVAPSREESKLLDR